MPQSSHTAKTGECVRCQTKYTNIISVERLSNEVARSDTVQFVCPKCGHAGTLVGKRGERITKVETVLTRDLFSK